MNLIYQRFCTQTGPVRSFLLIIGLIFSASLFTASCSRSEKPGQQTNKTADSEILCITGSEEMTYVMDAWISTFKAGQAAFEARGNGTVYKDLTESRCMAGVMTRPMSDSEVNTIVKKTGKLPEVIPVASDALVITLYESIANKNTKRSITIDQAKYLFTHGKFEPGNSPDFIKSDSEIFVFGHNSASDQYRFFKDIFLNGEDFSDSVNEKADSLKIKETISLLSAKKKGPSYFFSYMRLKDTDSRHIPLSLIATDKKMLTVTNDAVLSDDSIINEDYPIKRDIYLYTLNKDDSRLIEFVKHILSPAEQTKLKHFGFYPYRGKH
jgi:ABC-type phosphate transport system substrate-binding protein